MNTSAGTDPNTLRADTGTVNPLTILNFGGDWTLGTTSRVGSMPHDAAADNDGKLWFAVPPSPGGNYYADLDIDLGNPLQDLDGFIVHMGELGLRDRALEELARRAGPKDSA